VKAKLAAFEHFQMDTKPLFDIPEYWPSIVHLALPRYQYSIREVPTGAVFVSYTSELSTTYACLRIKRFLEHLRRAQLPVLGSTEFSASHALGRFGRGLCTSLGTKRPDGFTGSPHLGIAHGRELFIQPLLVPFPAADTDYTSGFIARFDPFVQFAEHRHHGFFERRFPVERPALGRGRTVRIHPVHTVLVDQPDKTLCQLFNRFVERFARAVPMAAQHVVLGFHNAGQRAHEHTAFARQIAVHFVLERRREQIARTDADTQRQTSSFRPARSVLEHGIARVYAGADQEIPADRCAGPFRRNHNHVHIVGRDNFRLVFIHDREPVREVERVAGIQILLDGRPDHTLGLPAGRRRLPAS